MSLDPQTRYSHPGDEDIDSFIKSFHGETSADSIVTPGASIQFFVEALPPPQIAEATSGSRPLPPLVFGTGARSADDSVARAGGPVVIVDDHFGAISTEGIYLSSAAGSTEDGYQKPPLHTKLDAPHSYIWEGPRPWLLQG